MDYKAGDLVRILHTDYEDAGLDVGTVHPVHEAGNHVLFLKPSRGDARTFYPDEVELVAADSPAPAPTLDRDTIATAALVAILLASARTYGVDFPNNNLAAARASYALADAMLVARAEASQ